jgi:hypothetical protein
MNYRQWYAQLDLFDTARRYLALLENWHGQPPSRDRLFVSDFYLVNPSLLHLTHMTVDVRRVFTSLKIVKPEQSFVKHPSSPILYSKMAGIQSQALYNLIGKGLLDVALVDKDQYRLSALGQDIAKAMKDHLVLPYEAGIIKFITTEFASIGQGKGGLRSVTGLRRVGT